MNFPVHSTKSSGTVSPSLVASRLSGPAPLAVFFDATATTSTAVANAFRNILYTFSYGEPSLGNWTISGLSKNTDIGGPVAAHVFETPGTYIVSVIANDGTTSRTQQTTITVTDPAVVYATTATIFVSPSADYSLAPAGSTNQTTVPTNSSGQYTNKRVMLNRGETFGGINIHNNDHDWQVCAGPGGAALPIVTTGTTTEGVLVATGRPGNTTWNTNGSVQNLDIRYGFTSGYADNLLIHKCTLTNVTGNTNNGIFFCSNSKYWAMDDPSKILPQASFVVPFNNFAFENTLAGTTGSPNCSFFSDTGHRLAIVGNTTTQQQEHSVRLGGIHKCFIAHNQLKGQSAAGAKHAIKLHSTGILPFIGTFAGFVPPRDPDPGPPIHYSPLWVTKYVVIANNKIGGSADNNTWMMAIRPQNSLEETAEGIEDIMIENNIIYYDGVASFEDLNLMGKRITYIGNTRDSGGPAHAMTYEEVASGYSTQLAGYYGPYYTSR